MSIHSGNLECFLECYKTNLLKAVLQLPQDYSYSTDKVDEVFERMKAAIVRGSFNKDSHAFRWTCKELGIKHTYKSIKEFISL